MEYSLSEVVGGLRRGEFVIVLEPQIDLITGKLTGFECLSRWNHRSDGLVAPGKFIPQLERHGLIGQLTLIIIERALRIRHRLRELNVDVSLSINISSRQLVDWNFPVDLMRLARNAGGELTGIVLEVTESSELSDECLSEECIRALSSLGVQLSLDDFWTGYSSLSKPNLDAFSEVKIDYQLTKRIESDKVALAGISSIQTFARMLGWRCVVEGIESIETVALLRAIGCKVGQGYLFAHPISESLLEAWIEEKAPRGYLEFLCQHDSDLDRTLPVADEDYLALQARSTIPIWHFNVDEVRMQWANKPGLNIWMAEDVQELASRTFSDDMSSAVLQRLHTLRTLLSSGGTIAEQWTIYPKDIPKQVYSVMKGVISPAGHFLLEIQGHEGIGPSAAASSGLPSADTIPICAIAVHEDGFVYWRNAAASRTFTSMGDSFFEACAESAQGEQLISSVLQSGAGIATLRIRNRNCHIPCRIVGTRVRDPATGKRAAIVSLTTMCDVYGCSHEALKVIELTSARDSPPAKEGGREKSS